MRIENSDGLPQFFFASIVGCTKFNLPILIAVDDMKVFQLDFRKKPELDWAKSLVVHGGFDSRTLLPIGSDLMRARLRHHPTFVLIGRGASPFISMIPRLMVEVIFRLCLSHLARDGAQVCRRLIHAKLVEELIEWLPEVELDLNLLASLLIR